MNDLILSLPFVAILLLVIYFSFGFLWTFRMMNELLAKKRKVKSIDLGIAFITLPVFVFSLLLYLSILGIFWLFSKYFIKGA